MDPTHYRRIELPMGASGVIPGMKKAKKVLAKAAKDASEVEFLSNLPDHERSVFLSLDPYEINAIIQRYVLGQIPERNTDADRLVYYTIVKFIR